MRNEIKTSQKLWDPLLISTAVEESDFKLVCWKPSKNERGLLRLQVNSAQSVYGSIISRHRSSILLHV